MSEIGHQREHSVGAVHRQGGIQIFPAEDELQPCVCEIALDDCVHGAGGHPRDDRHGGQHLSREQHAQGRFQTIHLLQWWHGKGECRFLLVHYFLHVCAIALIAVKIAGIDRADHLGHGVEILGQEVAFAAFKHDIVDRVEGFEIDIVLDPLIQELEIIVIQVFQDDEHRAYLGTEAAEIVVGTAAPDPVQGLEYQHLETLLAKQARTGKPPDTGTNDDHIIAGIAVHTDLLFNFNAPGCRLYADTHHGISLNAGKPFHASSVSCTQPGTSGKVAITLAPNPR